MDTNSAIADVRDGKARIWSGLKSPIVAQQAIARELGLKDSDVEVNVVQSGGSFGRRLFYDAALEAAKISNAMGVPLKLTWPRADDARAARAPPMPTSRGTAAPVGKDTVDLTQSHP